MKRSGEETVENQEEAKKVKLMKGCGRNWTFTKEEQREIDELIDWKEKYVENVKNMKDKLNGNVELFDKLIIDSLTGNLLARFYIYCLNCSESLERDWKECVLSMESDHLNAILQIGAKYSKQKEYERAMKWYSKAAERNNARAQFRIGIMHSQGKDVKKDNSKALEYFLKAAQQDFAPAQNAIGNLYLKGKNFEKSIPKSVEWFTKAAKLGNVDALINLGNIYKGEEDFGETYSEEYFNYLKSMEFYMKAFKKGRLEASKSIFELEIEVEIHPLLENDSLKILINAIENISRLILNSEFLLKNYEISMKDERFLIQFSSSEFIIEREKVKHSNFLTCLLNSNWKENCTTSQQDGLLVLDLKGIENDILSQSGRVSEIFKLYAEYNPLSNSKDFFSDKKFETVELFYEMCLYLGDDYTIFNMLKKGFNPIYTLYFMLKYEKKENIEMVCGIVSHFVLKNSKVLKNIPEHVVKLVLTAPLSNDVKELLNSFESIENPSNETIISVDLENYGSAVWEGKFEWKDETCNVGVQYEDDKLTVTFFPFIDNSIEYTFLLLETEGMFDEEEPRVDALVCKTVPFEWKLKFGKILNASMVVHFKD